MRMQMFFFVLVLAGLRLPISLPLSTYGKPSEVPSGDYSRDSVEISGHYGEVRTVEIKSPDGANKLVAVYSFSDSEHIEVYLEIGGRRFETDIGELVNSEVSWSPDSRDFAVTYSDGGAVGTYHARIYRIEKDGFRVEEPTVSVKKAFLSQKLVCFRPEKPNVAVICWLGSSNKILLAAEIPPHSNCDKFGTFKAYEVSLPSGKILKAYGQLEAKHLFGQHLGPELANSNDDCFLKPRSCQIPALHSGGPSG